MTFVPHKPERKITVEISYREASLLSKLRIYSHGKFVVHKVDGLIIRVELNKSELVTEDDVYILD